MPESEVNMPEQEVDIASAEDTLFSRIALSTNPRKASYLGYRSCGFSIRESCHLVPVSEHTLRQWRATDPEFAEFESNRLYELQKNIGPDILRLEFLRNFKLALKGDFKVLWQYSLLPVDQLSSAARKQLEVIRKHYGAQDLLALHKALEPEPSGEDDRGVLDRVVVIVNNEIVEGEAARKAAGRALLDQFKKNRQMLPEGKESDNGD